MSECGTFEKKYRKHFYNILSICIILHTSYTTITHRPNALFNVISHICTQKREQEKSFQRINMLHYHKEIQTLITNMQDTHITHTQMDTQTHTVFLLLLSAALFTTRRLLIFKLIMCSCSIEKKMVAIYVCVYVNN